MRSTGFAMALGGLALVLLGAGVAGAQSNDLRPLLDRLDRLERDMNLLQRQVYRGTGPGGAPVAVSRPIAKARSTTKYASASSRTRCAG